MTERTQPGRGWRHSEPLRRFLDGYLHQDFRIEYESPEAAARAFATEAAPRERRWVGQALLRFAAWADGRKEAEWRRALRAQGGAWRPPNTDAVRRLSEVLADRGEVRPAANASQPSL